jgi:CRISPR-associated RAMP protein (TIGR02581 family)
MNTFIELKNRYVLKGTLRGEEGLHIGTGVPGVDTDAPFIRQGNRPFLPGSSLRGAMRSTVERLVRSLWGPAACCTLFSDPSAGNDCWAGNEDKRKKLEQATSEGEGLRRDLVQGKGRLCPVCQLFGSTIMAARLKVTDARLKQDQEPVRRDGVGIDRDTETAAEQIKYDFEVLDRGCEFAFSLHLENADDNDLAGMDVGGKKSRGLGRVKLTDYSVEYFDERWSVAKFLSEGMAKEEKNSFEKRLRGKFEALVKSGVPGLSGGKPC